jgi:mono/diheme cytochrome c family protein
MQPAISVHIAPIRAKALVDVCPGARNRGANDGEVKGEQYIAVLSGWGGAYPLLEGQQSNKSGNERNVSRLLVFKLGAKAELPALPPEPKLVIDPPPDTASPATVAAGEGLYAQYCGVCHGEGLVAGGITPDLRGSPFIAVDAWYSVVLEGALKEGGMAPFAPVLDRTKATAIRAYVIHRANEEAAAHSSGSQHRADANQGAVIVAQGTGGAPACAACHAFTGGSDGSGAFPRIAGQPAFYLSRQLRDFSSGVRSNSIMSPIARYRPTISRASPPTTQTPRLNTHRWRNPIRSLSSGARNSPKRATARKAFPAAGHAMARRAQGSLRQSRISPDNMRITRSRSCRCGSVDSAGTVRRR